MMDGVAAIKKKLVMGRLALASWNFSLFSQEILSTVT